MLEKRHKWNCSYQNLEKSSILCTSRTDWGENFITLFRLFQIFCYDMLYSKVYQLFLASLKAMIELEKRHKWNCSYQNLEKPSILCTSRTDWGENSITLLWLFPIFWMAEYLIGTHQKWYFFYSWPKNDRFFTGGLCSWQLRKKKKQQHFLSIPNKNSALLILSGH